MNTEPNIPKLILGPSARDDQALNERLVEVEEAKDRGTDCLHLDVKYCEGWIECAGCGKVLLP